MNLRRQLLLVSLLLLCLPWAGCQFVREMEGALRQGQEQSLQATAGAVAALLGREQHLLYPYQARRDAVPDKRISIYAHPARQPVFVDGYGDGWEDVEGTRLQSGSSPATVTSRAQTRDGILYLLLDVEDDELVYHNPGLSAEPNGDRLVLRLWRGGRRQEYVIATAAPGQVRAKAANRRQRELDPRKIKGFWQDASGGYSLELQIPLDYTGGRLGFYLIDKDFRSGGATRSVGNITPLDSSPPPWLIYTSPQLRTLLEPFGGHSSRIQVVDKDNWLVADLPATNDVQQTEATTFWLLQLLYRNILSEKDLGTPASSKQPGKLHAEEVTTALRGNAASLRYRDPGSANHTLLSAAAPVADQDGVIGAVIVRQSSDTYLSLTDQAFSSLLGYSMLATGLGALALLGYASVLSWRIRRLSKAANNAIGEDGRVTDDFPRSHANDEIGELSRHYANLLERVREYNDYLRSLSRKLSHELRTPIAVIQSSLDNLEQSSEQAAQSQTYLERAREGLARLQRILTSMSEANRLEESIRNNQPVKVDLVALINEVWKAYADVYPEHRLKLAIEPGNAPILGVPDLVVQALDKLMDNAASFCPGGGLIELKLAEEANEWALCLCNEGPTLPRAVQECMFDPMVSMREEKSGDVHLGLGLHIVRLIVDFHRGKVKARNMHGGHGGHGGHGVEINILLPKMPEPVA